MTTQPSKTNAQIHSAMGTAKEKIGNIMHNEHLSRSGAQEHAAAQTQLNEAKAKGYVEGTSNRVEGKKDSVWGAITGDKSKQTHGNYQQEKGDHQQEFNRRY